MFLCISNFHCKQDYSVINIDALKALCTVSVDFQLCKKWMLLVYHNNGNIYIYIYIYIYVIETFDEIYKINNV